MQCLPYIDNKKIRKEKEQVFSLEEGVCLKQSKNISLLLGDFNAEVGEEAMQIFCDTYDFKHLVYLY